MEKREATCVDCLFFMPERREEGRLKGRCRSRPELGDIPEDLRACRHLKIRDRRRGMVKGPERPSRRRSAAPPRRQRATLSAPLHGDTTGEIDMDRDGLKEVLRELLEEETLYGYPEMGQRWQGGTLVLQPQDGEQKGKEIPIEAFFHKIVMIRDRLRVLEAKLNGHKGLTEQEKVELQGYITKCYGTLTTFNILFQDRGDHFQTR